MISCISFYPLSALVGYYLYQVAESIRESRIAQAELMTYIRYIWTKYETHSAETRETVDVATSHNSDRRLATPAADSDDLSDEERHYAVVDIPKAATVNSSGWFWSK